MEITVNNSYLITKTPIIKKSSLYAYLLNIHTIDDDTSEFDLQILIETLSTYGFNTIAESKTTFIPILFDSYTNDAIHALPTENIVLLLSNSHIYSSREVKKIVELKELGYHFALYLEFNSSDTQESHNNIFDYIEYVLVDTRNFSLDALKIFNQSMDEYNLEYIALHVDNDITYTSFNPLCKASGGGYYTQEIKVSSDVEISGIYKDTLELLNILEQDNSIDDIALSFTSYPEITLKLLQYLNSPAFNLTKAIKSIRHALLLIGKKSLKKWLLIIAFSNSDTQSGETNPLMYSVEMRIALMSHLANALQLKDNSIAEEAPFVAVLSLLDKLIEKTKEDLFKLIQVDTKIEKAVIKHEDTLGKLLELCIAIENFETSKVDAILEELSIDKKVFEQSLVESYFTTKEQ